MQCLLILNLRIVYLVLWKVVNKAPPVCLLGPGAALYQLLDSSSARTGNMFPEFVDSGPDRSIKKFESVLQLRQFARRKKGQHAFQSFPPSCVDALEELHTGTSRSRPA